MNILVVNMYELIIILLPKD